MLGVTPPGGSSPIWEIALAMELWEAVMPAAKRDVALSNDSHFKNKLQLHCFLDMILGVEPSIASTSSSGYSRKALQTTR